MNLRMASNEIEASLEEESAAALLLVSATATSYACATMPSRIDGFSTSSRRQNYLQSRPLLRLLKVDAVMQSMLAAYKTLQDVADLTQLSSTVEDVLASRDLPRAAHTLANMRHWLSSVGEVAEFADFRKQLEMLEDWLDNTVQLCQTTRLRLLNFCQGSSFALENLSPWSFDIQNFIWNPYTSFGQTLTPNEGPIRMRQKGCLAVPTSNNFQQNVRIVSFASWLPSFYDKLLLCLEQEWEWHMLAFPQEPRSQATNGNNGSCGGKLRFSNQLCNLRCCS